MPRSQFIYFIEPIRPDMPKTATHEEQAIVGRHFQFLKEHLEAGNLILAGPTTEPPYIGICVFEANDLEAAEDFALADPGIRNGVFRLVRVQPFRASLLRGS